MADGLLLVDKPAGVTSHDAVDICRRAYDEKSVGHLGTLDPFATGLLVLLLGRSTRLATFISVEPKVYAATIRFGSEMDTDDVTGVPTRSAALPSADLVRGMVGTLTGTIEQVPPAYSAKRVDGVRAYKAARRGVPLDLAPVAVRVDSWRFDRWRPAEGSAIEEVDVTVTCEGGTYIRALARDLGRLVDSAAHLISLRRLRAGPFDIAGAHALAEIREQAPALRTLRVTADD